MQETERNNHTICTIFFETRRAYYRQACFQLTGIWSSFCNSFSSLRGRTNVKQSRSGNKARIEFRTWSWESIEIPNIHKSLLQCLQMYALWRLEITHTLKHHANAKNLSLPLTIYDLLWDLRVCLINQDSREKEMEGDKGPVSLIFNMPNTPDSWL